ncbi:DUF5082 family protein [Fictibacillus sp. Mic-4]|uniref:YwqH-like family protein n=1 Tax=Fictibacillus TaxID=1329200 RepID=UPI0004284287|nr:DUF5082 family protein [Fictibacillus gelatini]
MGLSDMLGDIHASISRKSADVDEKISRLEEAKRKIDREQNSSLVEIKRILRPDLGNGWMGKRADSFHDFRNDAYKDMEKVCHDDYDDYKSSIEWKIKELEAERGLLNMAKKAAHEADVLAEKGEHALEELGNKINDLKRWLF